MWRKIISPIPLFVISLRLASALYILINPFWGLIVYLVFDYLDSFILMDINGVTWKEYQKLDKYLDWAGHVSMLIVGARYEFFWVLLILFIFRAIGQTIAWATENTKFLVLFPNFFEASFFWVVALNNPDLEKYAVWFLLLMAFQLLREIWLHLFVPYYLKKYGYPEFVKKLGYRRRYKWE